MTESQKPFLNTSVTESPLHFLNLFTAKKKRGNGSTNESNEDHTRSSEKIETSPTETINMNEDYIVPREFSTNISENGSKGISQYKKSTETDQSTENNKMFL